MIAIERQLKLLSALNVSKAQTEHYCKPRIALIGDSAHTVHPLAGLGANLGLLDAAVLAELLLEAHQQHRDFGRMQVLRRYERQRKYENQAMMYLMDGFKHLFENQYQAVQWLRNAGLDLFDSLPVIKTALMKRAMGIAGNLPKMAR